MENKAENLDLIEETLACAVHLQKSVFKYLNTPRSYGNNNILYMREAHLIEAIGNAGRMLDAEELATALDITHGAVTQLTERLEKKGYVYRDKAPEDKRRILRGLTPKGEEIYNFHRTFDENQFSLVLANCSDFTADELTTFMKVADRIAKAFSDEA